MSSSSTEALLFDLGGVVFGIDFEKAFSCWAAHAGVPAQTIKSRYVIDGAREIGMSAIHVRSIVDIRTSVASFLE